MKGNLDRLSHWLKENKITEVECLISDLSGIARGKISPTNKFLNEQGMRLPESVLLQTVTGDYVEDDIYYELLDAAEIRRRFPVFRLSGTGISHPSKRLFNDSRNPDAQAS